jgi:hypothetical protein
VGEKKREAEMREAESKRLPPSLPLFLSLSLSLSLSLPPSLPLSLSLSLLQYQCVVNVS